MLDWDDLRHFLAIHREGTLSRAATRLGINPTTVGRRLAALEERVAARLFDRTPDGYLLTPAGRDLLTRVERMEQEAFALEREIVGADLRPAGLVRVTATEMIATRFIAPELPRFGKEFPDITLDLICTTRTVSLSRREADVALRLARPREDHVVTRKLSSIPLALYASRGYVEEHGRPASAETSLRGHSTILFADLHAFSLENEWFLPRLDGARVALRSDSVSSIYSATLAGVGIALLPTTVADREPELVPIPTTTSPEPRVIWQTVSADLQKSARVRAVLDFLGGIFTRPED